MAFIATKFLTRRQRRKVFWLQRWQRTFVSRRESNYFSHQLSQSLPLWNWNPWPLVTSRKESALFKVVGILLSKRFFWKVVWSLIYYGKARSEKSILLPRVIINKSSATAQVSRKLLQRILKIFPNSLWQKNPRMLKWNRSLLGIRIRDGGDQSWCICLFFTAHN